MQAGFGLQKFGGAQYLPRVVALGIVREIGAGTAASAAVLALVNWAHHHRPTHLRRFCRPTLLRGLLGVAIAFPLTTTLALASSFGVGLTAYGIEWTAFSSGAASTLSSSDFAVGFAEAVVSGLVLMPLVSFLLPTITRLPWNLPLKLVATWSGLFAIGVLFRVVLSKIP
jgi:ABC-type transporter Mla maintaining outer membrane lipid asymmetry permease subunit MlaE